MLDLPYSLQVIQPLKELFLQEDFASIPNLSLKHNSDLSLIASNVSSLVITLEPTQDHPSQIASIFDSISEYVQDTRNIFRLQSIEHTSKAFASTIESSYSILNNVIAPTVDSIKKSIDARYSLLMVREKAEGLLESQVEPSESDYTFINWEGISSPLIQEEIIEIVSATANISRPELSPLNLSYVTKKLNFAQEFTDIQLPEAAYSTIFTKLTTALVTDSSPLTEETLKNVFTIFLSKSSYITFCNSLEIKFADIRNIVTNCLELVSIVNGFTIASQYTRQLAADDLSAETIQQLANNITVVMKTVNTVKYWLIFQKEQRFKSKLILAPTVLNGPLYTEFIQNGNSINDIHNYLKVFHLNTTLPLDGVNVDTVKDANTNERLEEINSKLKTQASFIKSKCLIAAYEYGIREFIKTDIKATFPQADERVIQIFSSKGYHKSSYLGGDPANLDKILYDLIICVFYENTLVATLYKYLGVSFDNLADNASDDIDNSMIIEAQCSAITELLIDYLFNMVVEKP